MHLFTSRHRSPALVALQQAVPGALQRLLRTTPLSDAKLAFAWRAVVGRSIARASTVALEEPDVLLVEVRDERWRQEVARVQSMIVNRLAQLLGPGVIVRLRIRVDARPQPSFRW